MQMMTFLNALKSLLAIQTDVKLYENKKLSDKTIKAIQDVENKKLPKSFNNINDLIKSLND